MFLLSEVMSDPWWTPLSNLGVAGVIIGWFMYRDKRESEKQDVRHKENIEQQKQIADAFRNNTESIIIGISALQTLDESYAKLLSKVQQQNHE